MSCAIALQHFYGRKTFELNNKNVLYKKGTHERAMNIFLKLTIFFKITSYNWFIGEEQQDGICI